MEKTFKLNYLRIAPRKVRLVADLVKGKTVPEALAILKFVKKRAARPITKLIHSGKISFALEHRVPEESLVISNLTVNEGPRLKRYLPRAYGRASLILKRSSHITLTLSALPGYKPLTDREIEGLIKKKEREQKHHEKTQVKQKEEKPKSGIIIPKIFRRKTFES